MEEKLGYKVIDQGEFLKKLLKNEEIYRPLVIFLSFFVIIIIQNWSLPSIFTILIIPLITFSTFLFFRINFVLKKQLHIEIRYIKYYPLGNEKIISERLFFCLMLELILILLIGTEGLYHPQLIDNHFIIYVILLVLIFQFSIYYSLHDIGFNAKVEIALKNEIYAINNKDYQTNNIQYQLISNLKLDEFSKSFKLIQFSFVILSSLWLVFSLISYFNFIPGLSVDIPGSDFLEGSSLNIPYFIFLSIISFPTIFIVVIKKTNKIISDIDYNRLNKTLEEYDEYFKEKILKIMSYYSSK
jgi:hypothetical protein